MIITSSNSNLNRTRLTHPTRPGARRRPWMWIVPTFLLVLMCNAPAQDFFTRITDADPVRETSHSFAVSWSDVDGDDDVDLFVANGFGEDNHLYLNDGAGAFERVIDGVIVTDGGDSTSAVWGDVDNDGDEDLFVVNFTDPSPSDSLYLNEGGATFIKIVDGDLVTDRAMGNGAAWGDADGDGDLDLVVANSGAAANFYYLNDGSGTFDLEQESALMAESKTSIGLAWADADGDGDLDLTVVNRTPSPHIEFFENLGGGDFLRAGDDLLFIRESAGQRDTSVSWADANNDGLLDLLVTSGRNVANRLYLSTVAGEWVRATATALDFEDPATRTGVWADFDNDGDLDLFLAIGSFDTGSENALLINDGQGGFSALSSVVTETAGNSWGAAAADVNHDGFLDLVVANGGFGGNPPLPPAENNEFFLNNGNGNHWLMLRLTGSNSNRSAIGARVRVLATIGGESRWQMREISGGHGLGAGQDDRRPHFGLGDATQAERVRIEWPSGVVQEFEDVATDQVLDVQEPPRITVESLESLLRLSWPGSSSDAVLEAAPTIEGPWEPVDTAVDVSGSSMITLVPVTDSARFFRLTLP